MKIAYASDLHFEFQEYRILRLIEEIDSDTDVLILAGDIQTHDRVILDLEYIHRELPRLYIVYITGNHEFYGAKISEVETSLKVAFQNHPKIFYLEKSTFELHGVIFLGSTLWTGFDAYPEFEKNLSEKNALRGIYDFKAIFQGQGYFQPSHCKALYQNNREWISNSLENVRKRYKTSIVVTHFPPLPSLNHGHIPIQSLANYFQTNCSDIIKKHQPDYWIYGHNHWSDEQKMEKTRLLSNQLGYPNEYNNSNEILKYFHVS